MNSFAPEHEIRKQRSSATPTMLTARTVSVVSEVSTRSQSTKSSGGSSSNHSFGSQRVSLPNGTSLPYALMMEQLKKMLPAETLKHNMTVYKNCFRADEAIKAFQENFPEIQSDVAAIAFGRSLQRARILRHVCDAKKSFRAGHFFFRLQCYQQPEILNSYRICNKVCEGDPMDALEVIGSLMLGVEKDITIKTSGLLDFRVASKSPCFPFLEDALCQLQGLDLGELTEMTRVAITLNIYNVMAKFAFMKVGAPVNRSGRGLFFSGLKMNVGGDLLSLDDLEHGILRGNSPTYGSAKSTYFAADDPRTRLVPTRVDPRIHFAIRCTPMAPGKTAMIYPHTLHYDLQREARRYLSDHANFFVDPANNEVHMNQIFQWYGRDFLFRGPQDWPRFARFLLANLEESKRPSLKSMLDQAEEKMPEITYIPFDWGTKAGNFIPLKPSVVKANEKRIV